MNVFVGTVHCRRRHFGCSPPPRHHATMPSPRDTAPGATFIKWTAKSNKLGEKHFWTPRIWNQSGGDVTGGEVRRQEKNNKALFFPSPPLASPRVPLCPNPLCRPAGKGRPAAKAGAAGKMWRLPSGSGGGGVAHSFVLPEASIQTRLYGQTGPAPGRSPAPSLTLSLSLSLLCLYTLTPGLSLCHTHTHTHTHASRSFGPAPCQPLPAKHSSVAMAAGRARGAEHRSEPTVMTHSWSQMCHICSHDGDSVCVCVCVCVWVCVGGCVCVGGGLRGGGGDGGQTGRTGL